MTRRVISAVLTLQDQSFSAGLRKANKQAGDFGRYVQTAQNKVESFGKKAKKSLNMAGTAAVALGTGAIAGLAGAVGKSLLDMDSSFAQLQAQTGAMGGDLEALENAAKETFSRGYGESLGEVTDAIARVKQNMHGIDNGEIADVASNALLLAQTMDSDVNEVTRGVNNTMEAFGVSAEKAFDLFTKGGQRGLNFSNEMFDNVAEYAPLFGTMGYSAEEYFGILERGSQAGVYNMDYLNDVMKEFQIRTKDGSKKTSDAMALMSKSTQKVWKSFLNGNGTVADVASTIVDELKGMDNQVKAGQIGVELFGTKFEDLESEAVYAMLGSTEAMKDFEGATEDAANAVEGGFVNRVKSAYRDLTVSIASLADNEEGKEFLDSIATTAEDLVPKIKGVAEKALEFANVVKDNWGPISSTVLAIASSIATFKLGMMAMTIVQTVTGFITAFRSALILGTGAQWAMNLAMAANPIGLVVAGIAVLIGIGVLLYKNWDTVKEKAQGLWDKMKNVGKGIETVWDATWNFVKSAAEIAINGVIGGINKLIETINLIPGVNVPIIAKVDWSQAEGSTSKNSVAGLHALESYDVGTNRVPRDMVARVHEDEMIIPAIQSRNLRRQGVTIDNIDQARPQRIMSISTTGASTSDGLVKLISELMAAIKNMPKGDVYVRIDGHNKSVTEIVNEMIPLLKLRLANM